jgi:tetratricopeptide (TPR) repeat protein
MNVKGKSEPVQVYTVNGIRPRSFRVTTRGVEGIETRTIGREPELERMKAIFETTASEHRTHLINIVAEAGLGKSRLLHEFGKWVEIQERPIYIFKGRATLEMAQLPYSLIRDILSNAFDIQDSDSAGLARDKLNRGIRKYIQNPEESIEYTHFIGHLIGFDFSTSPYLQGILGDARQIRDRAFHFVSQFFAEATRDQTILIFLEDIHWSDGGSLDLFDHLMSTKPDLPLLIVGLTRSNLLEQRPSWGTGPIQSVRLDVLPLSEENSRELVAEILQKVPAIPSALTDLIVQRAEGSPYYIEELIKILIEGGVIVRSNTQWGVKMDRLANLKVPATLTSLLLARLDSLPIDTREILQKASIVGRIFWMNVVENMQSPEPRLADTPVAINDQLNALRNKELIYQYEDAAYSTMSEYIFKSMILHDVTYESVLLRLRRIYHSQVAEGLIRLSGERVNENAGRIGEHYEYAGELLQAAEWYARAGRQAQNTYAPEAAASYYQKALAFFSQSKEPDYMAKRLEIHLGLSDVLNWQARYSDAIDNSRAMLQLAEANQDIVAQSRALRGLATSFGYLGDHRAALTSAVRAEELARRADSRRELANAIWSQGLARYRLGEMQAALTLAEQVLDPVNELNDGERAPTLNLVGAIHYSLGHYDQAEDYWESALSLFRELGDRQQEMDLLSNLGVIADARGDYANAFQRYDSALQIAREVGDRGGAIVFLTNRGGMQAALRNYDAADADLREAIKMAGITGSWIMPQTFIYHSEAALGLGNVEQALYSAEQALFLAIEDSAPEYIGMAWRALGMVAMKTGIPIALREKGSDHAEQYDPQACFRRSDKILTDTQMDGERARTLREWARYEFKIGNGEEGLKKWQEARDIFLKLGADKEAERMANPSA